MFSGNDASSIGAWGEKLAARFLYESGYHILHTNFWLNIPSVGRREIDLVAFRNGELLLAEVRTRTKVEDSNTFVNPVESVLGTKLEHMRQAAEYLVQHMPIDTPAPTTNIRMAIISVIISANHAEVRLIPID